MSHSSQLGQLLAANAFFADLDQAALHAVSRLCVTRKLTRNETLFLKNDDADALYAVRRGEIRIGTGTGDGCQLTLLLGPGDVFGEVALLDGSPRTADAVANEATELFAIRRRDFLGLLADRSRVALAIIELLCRRVRWMSARTEETNFLTAPARVARRIVALADDYGCDIHVAQDELAVFANTSRETVNRHLQGWKRRGLIELRRRRILLLDRDALGAVAKERALQ